MIRVALLAAASLSASPAIAQSAGGPTTTTPTHAASPADLALGRDIAARLLPPGTYQRVMGGAMSKMLGGMTDQMTAMPIGPLLAAAGLPPSETGKLDKATVQQIMDIVDPAYRERMRIMMPIILQQTGVVMTQFEPQMREGLAQAYATRFTPVQLADIARFLATPSGSAFAAQNMTIATDPAVVEKMQAMVPTLLQQMPAIMQKAMAATANLPKPKTPSTLTDADRAKLAQLLGVAPDKLKAKTP